MSLREVGDMVGASYMSVWRWERGLAEPQPRNSRRLEAAFDLPVETLLAETDH